jgi:regulator of protease activity HflC (stomatin/prohibitin superfamily)
MLRHVASRTARRATRSILGKRFYGDSFESTYSKGGFVEDWPLQQTNTILNIVPQGQKVLVERFGKYHDVKSPGWFFAIPLVDRLAYTIDMREKAIEIEPQPAITRDNVSLEVSGNVFIEFNDPHKAAYGSFNPLYAVSQNAQASMRAAIGKLELDEILHARDALNHEVRNHLSEAAEPWGITIKRYEITEILPDREIQRAMDKQAVAERERREQVLGAEGMKKSQILESEGIKLRKQNESEGELIKVRNEAKAAKERMVLEADGEAAAILAKAKAQAAALEMIGAALNSKEGQLAAQLDIAKDYLDMYGEMGSQSNTMVFSKEPGDVHAMLAQAAAVLTTASDSVKDGTNKN